VLGPAALRRLGVPIAAHGAGSTSRSR
jgi:hypothetical protein